MDSKTEVMVSLGAAIGANCIPCFDYIYAKAKEVELTDADIERIVEVAFKVKSGAQIFMRNAVADTAGGQGSNETPCCVTDAGCTGDESGCC